MEKIFLFILVAYGISSIVVDSSIFEKFRGLMGSMSPGFFGMLFTCHRCFGFWAGFGLSAFLPIINMENQLFGMFLHGCLSSGTCWIIATHMEHIELKNGIING